MRPADRAWLTGAAAIAAWDVFGPETLSSAADRYHHTRPWLTRAIVAYLALHLLGLWPSRGDPLHVLTYWKHPA